MRASGGFASQTHEGNTLDPLRDSKGLPHGRLVSAPILREGTVGNPGKQVHNYRKFGLEKSGEGQGIFIVLKAEYRHDKCNSACFYLESKSSLL